MLVGEFSVDPNSVAEVSVHVKHYVYAYYVSGLLDMNSEHARII